MNSEMPKNWNHRKTILRFRLIVFDVVASMAFDQGLCVNDEREIWGDEELSMKSVSVNVITYVMQEQFIQCHINVSFFKSKPYTYCIECDSFILSCTCKVTFLFYEN